MLVYMCYYGFGKGYFTEEAKKEDTGRINMGVWIQVSWVFLEQNTEYLLIDLYPSFWVGINVLSL